MDYISLITDDELNELCALIGAENFRRLYQKNSSSFSKIMPGFRANKLSEAEAVKLAIKNSGKPFISGFINKKVNTWLEEIDNNIVSLTSAGMSHENAIVQTLMDCVFSENIDLYFKLAGPDCELDFSEVIQSALNRISQLQAELKTENAAPSEESASVSVVTSVSENAEELNTLREDNSRLAYELEKSNATIQELSQKNNRLLDELKDFRKCASKADICSKSIHNSDYPYTSICQVYHDDKNRVRLKRLADINDDCISESFLKSYPPYPRLFSQSGPSTDDYIGIWNWRTIPNTSDKSKIYIETLFNEFLSPVEIVKCNCSSISELSNLLVDGVEADLCTGKILFSFWNNSSSRYEGLLCLESELSLSSGKYSLKPNVMQLPVFAFSISDIFPLNHHLFHQTLSMGMPIKLCQIRDELEMLKGVILKRAVWSAFKEKGVNHNVHNLLKDFIAGIPSQDLYAEISDVCECSVSHAEELLLEFEGKADEYIAGNDLDSETIRLMVEGNKALLKACKQSIYKDWEVENMEKIKAAAEELDSIKNQIAEEDTRLRQFKDEYSALKEKYDSVKEQLSKREQLAADVEKKVNDRINAARKNAADFISELAFTSIPCSVSAEKSSEINFRPGTVLSENEPDTNSSWEDTVNTIKYELSEAGVDRKYVTPLSAFLYSAYVTKCPVLLSGPNACDIADAFSCSLFGRTASRLDLSANISAADIDSLSSPKGEVIIIEHPFSTENNIPSISADKFIIAVNPYIDDLIIEPNGLLNYYIPVFTELFVSSRPTRNFVGGIAGEDFRKYVPVDADRTSSAIMNNIKISRLAENNILTLLKNTHNISGDSSKDIDYLFGLFPCAYVTGQCEALKEQLSEASCSIEVRDILVPYLGEYT